MARSKGNEMSNELTRKQATRLAELEAIIHSGLKTFCEVGSALAELNRERLHIETHSNFGDYCLEVFGISKTHAHRLINAAEVFKNVVTVSPIGYTAPTNEGQLRELAKVEPAEQAEVWQEVVETVATPTAKAIKAVVEKRAEPKPDKPKPTRKEIAADLKSSIKQHNAAMMRLVDDLHVTEPNKREHNAIHVCFRDIHAGVEAWK